MALAAASLPALRKGAQAVREVAMLPIMGWQRTTEYTKGRKNPKHVTETSSFTLRAWEVAALGFVGFVWIEPAIMALLKGKGGPTARPDWLSENSVAWGLIRGWLGE